MKCRCYALNWKERRLKRVDAALERILDSMSRCPWCYHGHFGCECHRGPRFDRLVTEHDRLKKTTHRSPNLGASHREGVTLMD